MPDRALGIERLAQVHDQPIPFVVRELALEVQRSSDADGQSEELARCLAYGQRDGLRRLRDELGGDADFLPDLLQL